jgi:CubicO group peptidase (beta-lactamase class C family)
MQRTPFRDGRFILRKIADRWGFVHCSALLLFLLALLLISGGTRTTAASRLPTAPDLAAIDAYVEAQIHEQRIPGLALGIVHGNEIIHLKGFGIADPTGAPVTAQTALSIGSLTKSFTAVAIMQLVEAGKLELDAPVQRYLPWFHVADQASSARMTLRHLLNHASGLPRDFETTDADRLDQDANALEERLRGLSTVELEQPIGNYGYSNVGYQVLAMVLQQVTGQSYEDYIRQHIFAPLDMRQSFATLSEAPQHQIAAGYHYWFGMPVATALPLYRTGPGNGGLFSSAKDMAHYLIAHLNQGHFGAATLLSPAGIAEVHRPAVPRPDGAYAMGWGVQTTNGVTLLEHSGQTYNYMAKMILVPDSQWGLVLLQNSQYTLKLATGDYRQDAIADGVATMLIGAQPPSSATSIYLLLAYAVLFLILVVQSTAIVRSIMLLRQWQRLPEQRPQGRWRMLRHGAVPLVLSLGWALLILIGLPATNNLTKLSDQIPDFTYTLLASGMLALCWGMIRAVWVYTILHRPSAATNDMTQIVQG